MKENQNVGPLGKVLRFILISIGIFIAVFLGFILIWNIGISVGYLNLTVNLYDLQTEANLAMEMSLNQGENTGITMRRGKFVKDKSSRTRVKHLAHDDRVVIFDRGGGHLGQQGYVYAPYAKTTQQVHEDAFGGFEGRELNYLYGSWWSYEGVY